MLTTPSQEEWASRRKVFVPFFHRHKLATEAVPVIAARTSKLVAACSKDPYAASASGVDIAKYMAGVTLDVLGEV